MSMPIDIYADDNESQIRFLAQRVDSLNEQVELMVEALAVMSDTVKRLASVTEKMAKVIGGNDA